MAATNGTEFVAGDAANPVAVAQGLTDSASLSEILKRLNESHLRVMLCIENAVELFEKNEPELANAYLAIAAEEKPLLNRIEKLLQRRTG